MSFQPQKNIAGKGIDVFKASSPSSVYYQGVLYLFYLGNGLDGIYYSTTTDGSQWNDIINIAGKNGGMSVAANTSPSAVVYQNLIYLFYNGKGNDGTNNGTWCTTFDGNKWTNPFSLSGKIHGQGFLPSTSPSAVVLPGATPQNSTLYLFWNGSKDNGIFFSTTSNGADWTGQMGVSSVGIASSTSPYATYFQGLIYLFWNGRSNDGTWYTTTNTTIWADQTSVSGKMGGQGFLPSTSPTSLVLGDNYALRLFWVGSGGSDQGAWYSDFNGTKWTGQRNMAQDIGGQGFSPSTNPCTVSLGLTPYVFWVGYERGLWYSSVINFDISSQNWWAPEQCFQNGQIFTVTSSNPQLITFIKNHIGEAKTVGPNPSAKESSALISQVTQNWDITNNQAIFSPVVTLLDWLTARLSNLQHYQGQLRLFDKLMVFSFVIVNF